MHLGDNLIKFNVNGNNNVYVMYIQYIQLNSITYILNESLVITIYERMACQVN